MENNNNNDSFSFDMPKGSSSIIKVIGVGGGGNNALKHMYEKGIKGVDFVICNTDQQTLDNNPVSTKIQLGISTTEGLGAGADPEVGEKAALESMEEIRAALGGNTKMIFITAGMGGGTGTGAAPVIAKIAREMGILTVAIVTIPFSYEGKRRLAQAEKGLEALKQNIDSLIIINNDKLRQQYPTLGFKEGFQKANEILTNSAKGMAEVITGYFEINIDFRDARTVLQNSGTALMSIGLATGENRAEEAVRKALDSPLLNNNKIMGAKNVLMLIRSGIQEATMEEIGFINDYVQAEGGDNVDIIFGAGIDEDLEDDALSVLVIATGFTGERKPVMVTSEKIVHNLNDHAPAKVIIQTEIPAKAEPEAPTPAAPEPDLSKQVISLEDDFKINPEPSDFGQNQPNDFASFADDSDPNTLFSDFSWDFEGKDDASSIPDPTPTPPQNSININQSAKDNEVVFKFVDKAQTPEQAQAPQTPPPQASAQAVPSQAPIDFEAMTEVHVMDAPEPSPAPEEKSYKIEQFTIRDKTPENGNGNEERRNKLQAFNARFDSQNPQDEFENIPAFKRKNIQLEEGQSNQNPSQANRFIDLNDPQNPQLKENRFLNKDVD
jgi:cell division protein FtsZ